MISFYRVHRCYIVDEEGKPIGVISISDLFKQLLSSDTIKNKLELENRK